MRLIPPLIAIAIYLLDQLTKWLILERFAHGEGIIVIPGFFNLVHVPNTGAAFGSFKEASLFFLVLAVVALIAILFFYIRGWFQGWMNRLAAVLLVGGIGGNLTDRIVHGHVIDFLDFHAGGWHWPAFNVADSAICIAAGLFIIASIREGKAAKAAR